MNTILAITSVGHGTSTLLLSVLAGIGFVVGMALSTQEFTLARQRFYHAPAALKGGIKNLTMAFWGWLANQKGKPDLQVKEFDYLTGTSTVIADVPCTLYAILLYKNTTVAAWFKGTDNASTGSSTAGEITLKQAVVSTVPIFFPKGFPMANGFTVLSNTTAAGNTTSAAGDGAAGLVLLAGPGV